MMREILKGTAAGAVGTVALDITSYADMAIRSRSASNAPARLVSTVANIVGLPLSSHGVGVEDETAQNRASGLGALLGYMNGLGMGLIYGLLRSQREEVSIPLASIGGRTSRDGSQRYSSGDAESEQPEDVGSLRLGR
jgi:hypothetical protein